MAVDSDDLSPSLPADEGLLELPVLSSFHPPPSFPALSHIPRFIILGLVPNPILSVSSSYPLSQGPLSTLTHAHTTGLALATNWHVGVLSEN